MIEFMIVALLAGIAGILLAIHDDIVNLKVTLNVFAKNVDIKDGNEHER